MVTVTQPSSLYLTRDQPMEWEVFRQKTPLRRESLRDVEQNLCLMKTPSFLPVHGAHRQSSENTDRLPQDNNTNKLNRTPSNAERTQFMRHTPPHDMSESAPITPKILPTTRPNRHRPNSIFQLIITTTTTTASTTPNGHDHGLVTAAANGSPAGPYHPNCDVV